MKRAPIFLSLLFPLALLADDTVDRPEHYRGAPAPTLAIAWQNYSEQNARLEALLANESLSARELDAIHQLTYTLENALQRISTDLENLAQTLESLHLASERAERAAVAEHGKNYLQQARAFRE